LLLWPHIHISLARHPPFFSLLIAGLSKAAVPVAFKLK
jgi:hypothetical protein